MTACQSLDRLYVIFDDDRAVANAGLILPATSAAHLGLEAAANELISLSGPGYFRPGRKAMTLVHAMVADGDCIGAQAELFDNWRHHAFITDGTGTTVEADADHRAHAVVELAIRDLKEGAGLDHCPSGRFHRRRLTASVALAVAPRSPAIVAAAQGRRSSTMRWNWLRGSLSPRHRGGRTCARPQLARRFLRGATRPRSRDAGDGHLATVVAVRSDRAHQRPRDG